jgi:hypothetical protein
MAGAAAGGLAFAAAAGAGFTPAVFVAAFAAVSGGARLAVPALVEYGSNPALRLSIEDFLLDLAAAAELLLTGLAGALSGWAASSVPSDSSDSPVRSSLRNSCDVDAIAVRAVSVAHCHTALPRSSCCT